MIEFGDIVVYSDVDDSILLWGMPDHPNAIEVMDENGKIYRLVPHEPHIKELREWKAKHASIVVWSAGGSAWARCAVRALGLTDIVDVCMSKPTIFIDDLNPNEFMDPHKRRYYHPFPEEK